jgi:hypothetical protein
LYSLGCGGIWNELANKLWENRFIGVSDLANIRFSLPAHLLEPTPNLGMDIGQIIIEVVLSDLQNTGITWIDRRLSLGWFKFSG